MTEMREVREARSGSSALLHADAGSKVEAGATAEYLNSIVQALSQLVFAHLLLTHCMSPWNTE